jgi:hypothetical protein
MEEHALRDVAICSMGIRLPHSQSTLVRNDNGSHIVPMSFGNDNGTLRVPHSHIVPLPFGKDRDIRDDNYMQCARQNQTKNGGNQGARATLVLQ